MAKNLFSIFVFLILLLAAIFLYRSKMKFDRPVGPCLLAWRCTYFGGAFFFFIALLFFLIKDGNQVTGLWIYLFSLGVFFVFIGMAISAVYPCGKKKK